MNFRTASLASVLAFAFGVGAFPASAQPAQNPTVLAKQLADLTARVDKLEGTITAADLAGTYAVHTIDTHLSGASEFVPASLAAIVSSSTVTLNADGTGALAQAVCAGGAFIPQFGAVSGFDCSAQQPGYPFTWTYANGVLSEFLGQQQGGGVVKFDVGVGGRIMTTTFAPAFGGQSDTLFLILTRLK